MNLTDTKTFKIIAALTAIAGGNARVRRHELRPELTALFFLLSHLQNNLFAQTPRYAQNFILGISAICLW
ncbi:hypothetical protein SAMN02745124_03277 [Desulfofustis glycolicus DSM 9705]|uniref:Uncharacterized protein n=1 Tax=Desulfofustis glycolicus DSM 9705 TaxID=1121409 RepID=A0A1M5XQW8_9BACT|nr:hypothetical protein SAMN02745124_03277 [Desulfofustis glycolicus DSM 9705]